MLNYLPQKDFEIKNAAKAGICSYIYLLTCTNSSISLNFFSFGEVSTSQRAFEYNFKPYQ